jgi:hypothetical protein
VNAEKTKAVVFWGPHSISSSAFAEYLGAPCYLIHYFGWKKTWNAPFKYPLMWIKTWSVLSKQKPSAVLVINTPVFAPLCVYTYSRFARIPFAMNVHGHTLGGRRWGWAVPLQRFLARKAVVNLVGTTEYEQIFASWKARTLFLEDPPLEIPHLDEGTKDHEKKFEVTVVSTFAGDEPLDLVVKAARRTPEIRYTILGDTSLAERTWLESAPENVRFPGYLKGNDYWQQITSSNAVMVLTTNPHSLVAGGMEGMYGHIPLLLSKQPALESYFTRGAIFFDHTVESIVEGVKGMQRNEDALTLAITELAAEKRLKWTQEFKKLVTLLDNHNG